MKVHHLIKLLEACPKDDELRVNGEELLVGNDVRIRINPTDEEKLKDYYFEFMLP